MEYSKLKEKMERNKTISTLDLDSGVDVFRLFRDQYIRFITMDGYEYELNFIPAKVADPWDSYDITVEKFGSMNEFYEWFRSYVKLNGDWQIHLDGEFYDVVLEVLETPK